MARTTVPAESAKTLVTGLDAATEVADVNVVDFFMEDASVASKTKDDIIEDVLLNNVGRAKLYKQLHVRNVIPNIGDSNEARIFFTFVCKENVIGNVADETDVLGKNTKLTTNNHNVIVSLFALASVMKDEPTTAVFVQQLLERPNTACELFAGGTIDVLAEVALANQPYVNPFSQSGDATIFACNKAIHHIVGLALGQVGTLKLQALVNR